MCNAVYVSIICVCTLRYTYGVMYIVCVNGYVHMHNMCSVSISRVVCSEMLPAALPNKA